MGHFSYTCILSGLPITSGEPCAIIPMIPQNDYYDNGEKHYRKVGVGAFCSNDGVNMFFKEVAYPIFGEYNEYGSLDNIIKDDNTKLLEEYYELTIEEIVEVLTDGRKDDRSADMKSDATRKLDKKNARQMQLIRTSITWVNADLYHKLANDNSIVDHYNKVDLGNHGLLLSLGFEYKGEVKRERYNKKYEKDGLSVFTDGNWIDQNLASHREYNLFTLPDLKKHCDKHGVSIDISKHAGKSRYEQLYDYILPTIKNIKGRTTESNEHTTHSIIYMLLGDPYSFLTNDESGEDTLQFLYDKLEKNDDPHYKKMREDLAIKIEEHKKNPILKIKLKFTEFAFNKIKENGNDFLKKNIVDWYKVKEYFYVAGRYLYPIGNSPQDGEPQKFNIMAKYMVEISEKQMKDRGYDEDETEE